MRPASGQSLVCALSRIGSLAILAALAHGCGYRDLKTEDLTVCLESESAEQPVEPSASIAPAELEGPLDSPEALRKLATTPFPLPRADFAVQMEWLARVVEAKLSFPDAPRYPNGSPDRSQIGQLLRFVLLWQHPGFIRPLFGLLRAGPEHRYHAAVALLRYGDPELRMEVVEYRGFEHEERMSADSSRILTMDQLLDDPEDEGTGHAGLEDGPAVHPAEKDGNAAPAILSIPAALSALESRSPSIRLQAWLWLADHSIIAPVVDVKEAWPQLSEGQRGRIVTQRAGYLGEDRLRDLHEWVFKDQRAVLSEEAEGELILSLSLLGSPVALRRAKQVVFERLPRLGPESSGSGLYKQDRLLSHAMLALWGSGRPGDLPCFLRLAESSNDEVRQHAWAMVAGIEHPEAIASLERPLLHEDPYVIHRAAARLAELGRKATALRWEYLDLLAKVLRRRSLDRVLYPSLLDAFSALAGIDFGPNGRLFPHGLDEIEARATTERCLEWYRVESPDRAPLP